MVLNDGFISNRIAFTINGNCRDEIFDNKSYANHEYKRIKSGIALTTSVSFAVFHSVIEGFSKYMPFYHNRTVLNNRVVIIPKSMYEVNPSYELFKLLGPAEILSATTPIIADDLIIPLPGTCTFGMKNNIEKLRNELILKIKKDSNMFKEKLLIIKRNYNRKINNFDEMKNVISKRFPNISIILYDDCAKYNYKEILLIFYESSIIIGFHGAGFTNIIACRKGTIIIEISTNRIINCYYTLSKQLGLLFFRYLFEKNKTNNYRPQSVTLNITEFKDFLGSQHFSFGITNS